MRHIKMILEVAEKSYKEALQEQDQSTREGKLMGIIEFTLKYLNKEVEANV